MHDFLRYIEDTTDLAAEKSSGSLDILEDDIIAKKTGLSIEEVKELRKKNS